MSDRVVTEGQRITFHFSLALESGEVVDSTFGGAPATFEFGDGNLPDGFARLLVGLRVGDQKTFTVPPEQAFGQPNPNNIQTLPRDRFPEDMALEPGLMVSFADAQNTELPGVVTSLEGDTVVVDFNHPLAGRDLTFTVEIVHVEPAEAPTLVDPDTGGAK